MALPGTIAPPATSDVTVIVPVWDDYADHRLQEALASVLGQEPRPRVMVIDNASVVPVVAPEGIAIIHAAERLTVGGARNLGVQSATTPWVIVWDADDVMPPGTVQEMLRLADSHDQPVAVAPRILDDVSGASHHWPRRWTQPLARWPRAFAVLNAIWSLYPTTGSLLRRSAVLDGGGFADVDGGDDWVLGASLAFRGRVVFGRRHGRLYRRSAGSISADWHGRPDIVTHARLVRERVQEDAGVPQPIRTIAPAFAPVQQAIIAIARPVGQRMPSRRRERLPPAVGANLDAATVLGFGEEWSTFDQSRMSDEERGELFDQYFAVFPWERVTRDAKGFDLGCGSGRWALKVAPRVGRLHLVDASKPALEVARRNLAATENCDFHHASVDGLPFAPASMDFGYSLGVLHHVPDTAAALRSCARVLRPGAPFLLYLYYALDTRPAWYRTLWRLSDPVRRVVSKSPTPVKLAVSTLIAYCVYWPLARVARIARDRGVEGAEHLPLAYYADRSLYTMRTDAFDRFSTRLEKRFTRHEIESMLERAGFEDCVFSPSEPYWCVVATRSASAA